MPKISVSEMKLPGRFSCGLRSVSARDASRLQPTGAAGAPGQATRAVTASAATMAAKISLAARRPASSATTPTPTIVTEIAT